LKSQVDEIAPDLFRISTYFPKVDLQFNQFLVRDEEPLLYHTGMRGLFALVRQAVEEIIDPATLRWIGFSHFEADECGCLNPWLAIAPEAKPVCGIIGAMVNINDFADRRAHVLADGQVLATGRHRFRFLETPQLPHGWDASLLFEETGKTLFCSDLFLQNGAVEAVTDRDLLERARQSLLGYQAGPLANSFPYTPQTDGILQRLAELAPLRLATMHGSTFFGDGGRALRELAVMLREVLDPPPAPAA
jgi:flavorubredoxin